MKHSLTIDLKEQLLSEFKKYCEVNNFDFLEKFEEVFQSGFTVEKYGATPNGVGKLLNPSQEIEELTEQVENLQKQLTECNNKYIIYRQQSTPPPPRNTRYRKPGDNLYVD